MPTSLTKDNDGKHWKVVPVEQITNLAGTHLRPYKAATKEEPNESIELKYKSGRMWISRTFAHVA